MNIDLDSLEVLEAIVETGTFARAARKLHRTQSAVSYGISKLEERLGVTLFDRSGHRAVLTDEGQIILEEGRVLLARARRLEAVVAQLGRGWEASVKVIIDGILPMGPILGVLRPFVDLPIPTRIQVKMEYLGGVQYRFEQDDADIMVVKDYEPHPRLTSHALGPVTVALVCVREHPLARSVDHPVDRTELQEHVELTVQDSSPSPREDLLMFGGSRVFHLSDFHTKREALIAGLGFGWMPLDLIRAELERGTLVEIPYVGGARYEFVPYAVYRSDRPLGRAGRMFLDNLLGAVG